MRIRVKTKSFRHRHIHIARVIENAPAVRATDNFLLGLTLHDDLPAELHVAAAANAVLDAHPMTRVAYFPRREPLVAYLRRTLKPGDLCLALSAGDLTAVTHELLHDAPAAMAG